MMRCSVGGSRAANILCSLKIFNFSCYRRAGGEVMPEGRIEADYCLCSTHRYDDGVAPHAGAWIETPVGLIMLPDAIVAPHAGAWIETRIRPRLASPFVRRASCRRVD